MIVEKTQPLMSSKTYLPKNLQNFRWFKRVDRLSVAAKQLYKNNIDFENSTGIKFTKKQHLELKKTVSKFPLCITPYYASLIDIKNYQNDPIFKQAFPNPAELN